MLKALSLLDIVNWCWTASLSTSLLDIVNWYWTRFQWAVVFLQQSFNYTALYQKFYVCIRTIPYVLYRVDLNWRDSYWYTRFRWKIHFNCCMLRFCRWNFLLEEEEDEELFVLGRSMLGIFSKSDVDFQKVPSMFLLRACSL
jgi:hypothetical protein